MGSGLLQGRASNHKPEITILRIAEVHAHEEDIPALTRKLTQQIKQEKVQRDPIIVDRNTKVILDGVHRKTALQRLGCDKTVAFLVEYSDSSIKLRSWFPCLRGRFVKRVIRKLGMKNIGIKRQKWHRKSLLVVTREGTFSADKCLRNTGSTFEFTEELLLQFTRVGCKIVYETEDSAFKLLDRGQVDAVVPLPRLKKAIIVEAARTGKIFGPKTTRHIIPKRPIDLRVPLDLLRPETPIEAARDRVRLILSQRKKILRRSASSGSRTYEESVCVFE